MSYRNTRHVNLRQATLILVDRLAEELDIEPGELVAFMIEEVVKTDMIFRDLGLGGLAKFKASKDDPKTAVAKLGVYGLALNVRPSTRTWPDELPFDWTPAECKAALLGCQVRWRGSRKDFKEHMPGSWQVDGSGFANLKRRRARHTA